MITTEIDNLAKKVKSDFPFFTNNPDTIYLDSGATSLKPQIVIDAIVKYYEVYSANIHRGVYKASMDATEIYESTRSVIKNFVGADDDYEVIYLRNTTEAMNLLAFTLNKTKNQLAKNYQAWQNGFEKGDVILITESEHHSNIVPWQMIADEKGLEIVFVPILQNGELSQNAFAEIKEKLKNRCVKVVSLSQVSNVTGIIHNLEPFRTFAREKGAVFIVDGAQAVCHHKINLNEIDADAFAFSGHKMLGPTGTGVLLAKKGLLDNLPPFLGGGDMILDVTKTATTYNKIPHKFEAGTPDIAGVFGLRAAIEYLDRIGMDNILNWEKELLKYGMKKLDEIGVHVFGPSLSDLDRVEKAGVLSFNIPGIHPHDVGTILDEHNVCIRAGHHCCQLLMQAWNTSATNRASFYLYNDFSDIDKLVDSIGYVKKIFKK
ncbi:MAG: SufS family cysteine desulfurase [Spirochaetia bacterium]|nr:SufS family cysteine desulfurase [Spirochaetia bacterium]